MMLASENHQLAGCVFIHVCMREHRTLSSLIKGKMFNVYGKGWRFPVGRMEANQNEPNAEVPKWWDLSSLFPSSPSRPVFSPDASMINTLVSNLSDLLLRMHVDIIYFYGNT